LAPPVPHSPLTVWVVAVVPPVLEDGAVPPVLEGAVVVRVPLAVAAGAVVAGVGACDVGGAVGDAGVLVLVVSGVRAKVFPRTSAPRLGAAVVCELPLWTPWPMANPPAKRATATEAAPMADGILMRFLPFGRCLSF
jgi:hypothetical protein